MLQSNLLNTDTKETERSVHITEVSVLQTNILNTKEKGTGSTLRRCLHWSQTSLIQTPKGLSGHITEVSVLQSNLLNTPPKGQCPNYTGSLITDDPP